MNKQYCHYCKKHLKGRADKKFCNEYCRNCFHNEKRKREHQEPVTRINRKLRYNRTILMEYLVLEKHTTVFKQVLIERGFSFLYFTHQIKDRDGALWNICYDTAYRLKMRAGCSTVIITNGSSFNNNG